MGKEIKKLRELTQEELLQQLSQSKTDLLDHRFQIVTGHVTNVKKSKSIRKKIARIKTIQSQRFTEIKK